MTKTGVLNDDQGTLLGGKSPFLVGLSGIPHENEQVFEKEERVGPWVQPVELGNGQRTTTVLGDDHLPLPPVEEYLEYLRAQGCSPNTVKSYARAIALWFEYLSLCGESWDDVGVDAFGGFLNWLRSGDTPRVTSMVPGPPRFWPPAGFLTKGYSADGRDIHVGEVGVTDRAKQRRSER